MEREMKIEIQEKDHMKTLELKNTILELLKLNISRYHFLPNRPIN